MKKALKGIFNEIGKNSEIPAIYSPGSDIFWQDEYISEKILQTHLDFTSERASKKIETIEREVEFITEKANMESGHKIIDLGCGPGLYCERFYKTSHNVTGVDFSARSIDYAVNSASGKNMKILYLNENYLELDYENEFDLIYLIFFDFGTFSMDNTHKLLEIISRMLKKGGQFVFDVRTLSDLEIPHDNNWYVEENGFWGPGTNLILEQYHKYEKNETLLYQITSISESEEVKVYRIYENFYSVDKIKDLLKEHVLIITDVYEDLTGKKLDENSKRLGIFSKKI